MMLYSYPVSSAEDTTRIIKFLPTQCPPYGNSLFKRNTGDINGDGRRDWLIRSVIKETVVNGKKHKLYLEIYCLAFDETFTYRFLSLWGSKVMKSNMPGVNAPGAPNPACPFGGGRNTAHFSLPGPDSLPTCYTHYSKNPENNHIQMTKYDVKNNTFTQMTKSPGEDGYPYEAPPGVDQMTWNRYLGVEEENFNQSILASFCSFDDDGDGVLDSEELELGTDFDLSDSDMDGFSDSLEIALLSDPVNEFSTPEDLTIGNTCDDGVDNDLDGKLGNADNDPDPGCIDFDGDNVPDIRDNCNGDFNPDQRDIDGDGLGAPCDLDDDDDGILDVDDLCPESIVGYSVDAFGCMNDIDGDSLCDYISVGTFCGGLDNCPGVYNPDQTDTDQDGIGDACDCIDNLELGLIPITGENHAAVTLKIEESMIQNATLYSGSEIDIGPNITINPLTELSIKACSEP